MVLDFSKYHPCTGQEQAELAFENRVKQINCPSRKMGSKIR